MKTRNKEPIFPLRDQKPIIHPSSSTFSSCVRPAQLPKTGENKGISKQKKEKFSEADLYLAALAAAADLCCVFVCGAKSLSAGSTDQSGDFI